MQKWNWCDKPADRVLYGYHSGDQANDPLPLLAHTIYVCVFECVCYKSKRAVAAHTIHRPAFCARHIAYIYISPGRSDTYVMFTHKYSTNHLARRWCAVNQHNGHTRVLIWFFGHDDHPAAEGNLCEERKDKLQYHIYHAHTHTHT